MRRALSHYSRKVLKSFGLTATNVDHVRVDNPEKITVELEVTLR